MNEKVSYLPRDAAGKKRWATVSGPWNEEPDRVEWRDPATALPCLALRHPAMGHWCGYVGVSPEHPWHGKRYDQPVGECGRSCVQFEYGMVPTDYHYECTPTALLLVHGGVNFANPCQPENLGEHRVCHKPEPGEADDVWWFGFDCAHALDESPLTLTYPADLRAAFGSARFTYRTLDYVRAEVASLAAQLAEVRA